MRRPHAALRHAPDASLTLHLRLLSRMSCLIAMLLAQRFYTMANPVRLPWRCGSYGTRTRGRCTGVRDLVNSGRRAGLEMALNFRRAARSCLGAALVISSIPASACRNSFALHSCFILAPGQSYMT